MARTGLTAIAALALEHGLLVNAARPDTLRFMPSLTVSLAEIDRMAEILAAVFDRAFAAAT